MTPSLLVIKVTIALFVFKVTLSFVSCGSSLCHGKSQSLRMITRAVQKAIVTQDNCMRHVESHSHLGKTVDSCNQ